MITIRTFLRSVDGSFVRLEDCVRPLPDSEYVEGAIELTVDGVEIMGLHEWDYVDQLWSYIVDMMHDLRASGRAVTFFPDQPIELSFEKTGQRVLVSCRAGDEVRRASVPAEELPDALRAEAQRFFTALSALIPENAATYESARSRLAV
jgi:hypothetical protein